MGAWRGLFWLKVAITWRRLGCFPRDLDHRVARDESLDDGRGGGRRGGSARRWPGGGSGGGGWGEVGRAWRCFGTREPH